MARVFYRAPSRRSQDRDDQPVLTDADLIEADHNATLARNAGIFAVGYYDVRLLSRADNRELDMQIAIV
jgi:hypothetical protein